jgi:hypothetical protein
MVLHGIYIYYDDTTIGYKMTNIDIEQINKTIDALQEVVEEVGYNYEYVKRNRPDNPMVNCWYVTEDGHPDCIVGRTVFKMGLKTIDQLKEKEGTSAYNLGLPLNVATILDTAQRIQDGGSGYTSRQWGVALLAAKAQAYELIRASM